MLYKSFPEKVPFVFISHKKEDKISIARVLPMFLKAGVHIVIDRPDELMIANYRSFIEAGFLFGIPHGNKWSPFLKHAVKQCALCCSMVSPENAFAFFQNQYCRNEIKDCQDKLLSIAFDNWDDIVNKYKLSDFSYEIPFFESIQSFTLHRDSRLVDETKILIDIIKYKILTENTIEAIDYVEKQKKCAVRYASGQRVMNCPITQSQFAIIPFQNMSTNYFWLSRFVLGPYSHINLKKLLDNDLRIPTIEELSFSLQEQSVATGILNPFGLSGPFEIAEHWTLEKFEACDQQELFFRPVYEPN